MRGGLRLLITGGIFGVALGSLVLLAGMEIWLTNRRAESNLETHVLVLGNTVASAVETAERRGAPSQAALAFEQTRGDRRLGEAVIVDHRDIVVHASRLTLRGAPLADSGLAEALPLLADARRLTVAQVMIEPDGQSVLSVFPIRAAPSAREFVANRFGALIMRHELAGEKARALADLVRQVFALGVVLAVLCAVVWMFLNRSLIRPIARLVDGSNRLARGESVQAVSGGEAVAEIGQLARAFDQMALSLQQRSEALEESHGLLYATMDALPSHVAVLDERGVIIAVNRAWRSFGRTNGLGLPDDGVGSNYLDICDRKMAEGGEIGAEARAVCLALKEMLAGERTSFELDYSCDGPAHERWFSLEARRFSSNGTLRILMAHQNITSIKLAERALRAGEERYRTLYDNNPSMFLTLDSNGGIVSINDFGAVQLGYRPAELVGRPFTTLYPEEAHERIQKRIQGCLGSPGQIDRWEVDKQGKDGQRIYMRETARSIRGAGGEPAILIVCEDITETQELSERLRHQASHDALTGLINRYEFERRLDRAVESARSEGAGHVLCYVDLDQFKVVNDTCGHMAGDELLRRVAHAISSCVRSQDTLARLGGDEFGILMEHCPVTQGLGRAESVRQAVEDFRFAWEANVFSLGASIGVARLHGASANAATVMSAADAACYVAKDQGRNRVSFYDENRAEAVRDQGQMRWVSRLQRALDEDRFELYYQRIVPLDRARENGSHYELLVRLVEDGEVIPPGAFLPAAERFQLASRIDRWVVSAYFDWLADHPEHARDLGLCTINLSGQSLADSSLQELVAERLDSSNIPARKIGFEITETAAISDLTRAMEFMRRLGARGCRFALDDFGSGLSSFAYLKHLPVDILKIDGVFVRDIADDPIDAAMVRSINQIGQVMGKLTVAEFVESQAIMDRLRAIGVDFAQGYAIHRPAPLREFCIPSVSGSDTVETPTDSPSKANRAGQGTD